MMRAVICLILVLLTAAPAMCQSPPANIHENSLHHKPRGFAFWYSREQGGVERLLDIPVEKMGCMDCHVKSCEDCHLKQTAAGPIYSRDQARKTQSCMCHDFARIESDRKRGLTIDVHFEKGMVCMDCHTAREVHGDGKVYRTSHDDGAMDARCTNCHAGRKRTVSHTVHGEKVDCISCHMRATHSCFNCHYDTQFATKKGASFAMKDVTFLINRKRQVTLASTVSWVYKGKTMIEFAPSFRHRVVPKGRACAECHATSTVVDMRKGTFLPVSWDPAHGFSNRTGVIPVVENIDWKLPFLNHKDGVWTLISNPAPPMMQYSGFSTPLTEAQFRKLERQQPAR